MKSRRSLQREAIASGKEATRSFREAMQKINPGRFTQEISQGEFVARRNRYCSGKYRFRTVPKGSKPLTKLQIQKL